MKKLLVVALSVALLLSTTACGTNSELEALKQENEQLKSQLSDTEEKTTENPTEKPTEKRVVNIPTKVEFEFTKKLEGRQLKAGEFSFVLKDSKGNVIETVSNDANGKIKFSALEYKRGEEGNHVYTVEEVKGNDATVAYDKMVATVVVLSLIHI